MNNNFSENIKKIRKENNLSQEQLAEELGVSRQAISKWESGAAYPEMDKIITICKKYNVNIDDLLHNDIKEVKGEEETKNNINKYIEAFFKFITDSFNMFVRMKFGSKLKLIFEEGFIAFVLWFICLIVYGLFDMIISHSPLSMLPTKIYNGVDGFITSIYWLVAFVVCVIIMVRIFKARYLDYYQSAIAEVKETTTDEINKKLEANPNGKIQLKQDSKIIVRNPKNSDYHLLRGLFKIFLIGVKAFVLWMEIGLCSALVFAAFAFAMSFLVVKTGVFFFGCALGCLSAIVALSIIIILLFNFVFNRKSNKKLMIWSFVASIIVGGMSIGMITIGSFNFDVVEAPRNTTTSTFEIDMNENSFVNDNYQIEYIVEERNNIRIEVEYNDLYTASYNVGPNGAIDVYDYPENGMRLLRNELKGFNEKKIYPMNSDLNSIKVYASASNIEKLKNNHDNYFNKIRQQQELIDELRDEITEKNKEIDEKDIELEELRSKLIDYEQNDQVEE